MRRTLFILLLIAFTLPEAFAGVAMDARLYDPVTARFLAPDNYVQDPTYSQNFNRYSYCLNNPLKYTDL